MGQSVFSTFVFSFMTLFSLVSFGNGLSDSMQRTVAEKQADIKAAEEGFDFSADALETKLRELSESGLLENNKANIVKAFQATIARDKMSAPAAEEAHDVAALLIGGPWC